MADSVICARSFAFGCRLLQVCAQVWDRGPAGRHIAQQLMRSGTSIGANAEEAVLASDVGSVGHCHDPELGWAIKTARASSSRGERPM